MAVQLTLPEGQPWTAREPEADTDEAAVLACLRLEHGLTWTREQLWHQTGLSDRAVRRAVDLLRDLGWCIVPARGGGYRLTGDPAEVRAFADQQRRRALSILLCATRLERALTRSAALAVLLLLLRCGGGFVPTVGHACIDTSMPVCFTTWGVA